MTVPVPVPRSRQAAPYVHDLEKLAVLAGIFIDEDTRNQLRTISTFNIAARYDDAKLDFYKRCTKKYTAHYFAVTRKLWLILKKHSPKK